ncbi:MAG: hypothetical protein COX65_09775 [Elusimicrobia bacterium CG_4_10_14_0_2_um_filter_56_8]|nr:MAG: hypothetical protein COX65_09775 [Elusimicrobia bacterium CG_4_10_14_0_2_um_filter_56_8]
MLKTERKKEIKVLIIEDNVYDSDIVAGLFRGIEGGEFSLRCADTLEKARESSAAEKPDIILLDLNLPDSFGPQTLDRAIEIFKGQPIIVMTGYYEDRLGVELIKNGAQDYLVKGKMTGDWLAYSVKYSIERAKIEARLKQHSDRLHDILEKLPDGALIIDQDRMVVFANLGAELIFGRSKTDLLSHPFTLEADIKTTIETDLKRPDGKRIPVEIRAAEISYDFATCRLVTLRDLTAVRTLERSRDEFISRVSHELRSPLTVVKEALALIYDETAGKVSPRQKEILKMGLDNTARVNKLIDAMLDITKIEAGVMPMDLALSDLTALLSEITAEYSYVAAAQKMTLRSELPASPVSVYCDIEKLREVFTNLLSNALKFTAGGGNITLSLKEWEGQALICIQDSGPGIEAANIPLLFNKFTQVGKSAPPGVKGTGLGLAISRGIVEMHQGRIWAESEPGKGSRFYVLLPLLSFEDFIRNLVRREIELSSGGKRQFCTITLALPQGMTKDGNGEGGMAARTEAFIKGNMRNAYALVKRGEGEFTILLSDAGLKECARAGAVLEKGVAELADLPPGKAFSYIFALSYPEDFNTEDAFTKKMHEARGLLND